MTVNGGQFPVRPASRVKTEDVVRYLTELSAQGYPVYRDSSQLWFYIELNDSYQIGICQPSGGLCQVQLQYLNNMQAFLDVNSIEGLQKAVGDLVRRVPGMTWPNRPTAARTSATTPATNYNTISKLIGSAQVEAVFDPYLTNGALEELTVILSFGSGTVAYGVRLLGSSATISGGIPRFTKPGVNAWLQQLSISGEARLVAAKSEHRRFLLLSGGHSLLLGHSLNAIHKNEAVRLEADNEDRPFFDKAWAVATPLV